jgi:hypothetical protein
VEGAEGEEVVAEGVERGGDVGGRVRVGDAEAGLGGLAAPLGDARQPGELPARRAHGREHGHEEVLPLARRPRAEELADVRGRVHGLREEAHQLLPRGDGRRLERRLGRQARVHGAVDIELARGDGVGEHARGGPVGARAGRDLVEEERAEVQPQEQVGRQGLEHEGGPVVAEEGRGEGQGVAGNVVGADHARAGEHQHVEHEVDGRHAHACGVVAGRAVICQGLAGAGARGSGAFEARPRNTRRFGRV